MSWYNHFSDEKYKPIHFTEVKIGEKFRKDLFHNKRRRKDLIMIKTSDLSYKEFKSGREHKLFHSDFTVRSFDKLVSLCQK